MLLVYLLYYLLLQSEKNKRKSAWNPLADDQSCKARNPVGTILGGTKRKCTFPLFGYLSFHLVFNKIAPFIYYGIQRGPEFIERIATAKNKTRKPIELFFNARD